MLLKNGVLAARVSSGRQGTETQKLFRNDVAK